MSTSHADTAPRPLRAHAGGALNGRIRVPGDKSISHRALILGALSVGRTRISGLLEATDVLNTAKVVTALGARAERDADGWLVTGRGLGGLRTPADALDFGNSGTGSRLMMGVVAGEDVTACFTGDASLCKRPMGRVLRPLQQMGLEILEAGRETLPLTLKGTSQLVPMTYTLPVASAQVKSAILLAGLHAAGTTTVIEPTPTRDHTERMFRHFGADIAIAPSGSGRAISVRGQTELIARDVTVPGDPSSAAFLAAAALLVPGSEVTIEGVLTNPTRTGLYTTLLEMGADLAFENEREQGGEPVADLRVRHSRLTGVTVPAERAPSMIDEYPILAVLAAFADGETRMEGLAELKVKESDRLAATAAGLTANGVTARVEDDRLVVTGSPTVTGGGLVITHMDHRIAMAFLVMGLASAAPVTVDDVSFVATSFPEFEGLVAEIGGRLAPAGETRP
ncbi:MAG: 3-phosphoshikimate 1-carboxyvinyltransferase [Hyphomicrobiaceae bacterium]